MKKLVFFALLISNAASLFAQEITTPNAGTAPITTIMPNTTRSAPSQAPGSKSAMLSTNNITDNLAKMETLKKFFHVLEIAGLNETFKSAGPVTLFVPDDAAFEKISKGTLDTLLRTDHKPELIAFVTYHAVAGKMTIKNITHQINKHKNLATFTTLSGGKLTAKFDADGKVILIDEIGRQSAITQTNITQSNGMLFVINNVMIPKNKLL